ncbi:MAG TPA: carboxypeptidase-like regulatory domain-containing protein, partial [Bacteroidota bacterium]
MRKFHGPLFVVLLVFFYSAESQTISGRVVDEQQTPLQLVNVSLPALHRGAVTDEDGRFILQDLRPGVYTVEFSLVSYKKEIRTITLSENIELAVVLSQSSIELPGVIVTATPQPTDALSSSQSV